MENIKSCKECSTTVTPKWYAKTCRRCYHRIYAQKHKQKNKEKWHRLKGTAGALFSKAKSHAKSEGHPFLIPPQAHEALLKTPCFYCKATRPPTRRGWLDRINNADAIGYTEQNVLPCCGECNQLRGHRLSVQETLVAVQAIKTLRKKVA